MPSLPSTLRRLFYTHNFFSFSATQSESQRQHRVRHLVFVLALIGAIVLLLVAGLHRLQARAAASSTPRNTAMPALQGQAALDHLKQQGTYDSLQQAMSAIGYEARWQDAPRLAGPGAGYELKNAANDLLGYVTAEGLRVTSLSEGRQPWQVGLQLKSYGDGSHVVPLPAGEVKAGGNRVDIERAAVSEWYINTPRGLEQGFDVARPPGEGVQSGRLRIELEVSGDMQARMDATGKGVVFSRAAEDVVLSYDKLFVADAKGRAVQASMLVEKGQVVIEVDDATAEYPLRIDPLLRQLTKLVASDGAAVDNFGVSVAISDDTAVVGAYRDDVGGNVNQGSAYVFVRSGMSWAEQAQLVASDGAASDFFGRSVAISSDTVFVGASSDDVGADADQGSAYVFVRSGSSWTEQAKLTASDGAADDTFGESVAISGDTAVVGAGYDDVGVNSSQGSAYVFTRSGTSWTEQAKLVASDGAAADHFGGAVAISGNTAVVGVYLDDIGANSQQGSAYVFLRSGMSWSEEAKLVASDGAADDWFGASVAISGDTIVVGSYHGEVGANINQGSTYVFVRNATNWAVQAKLVASDGAASDYFGVWVAISGDTIVIGSYLDDVGANADQGSAYVFVRNGTAWTEQQRLTASDGAASDHFGHSVAISGDTVVVAAFDDDVGANSDQGSAYLFVGNWTSQILLMAGDAAASDSFGSSVAISGDVVVVGAYADDVGASSNQGSAYVFVRSGGWTEQAHLTASDGAGGDYFGVSVAISGDTVVVGAYADDVGANSTQGSAYVFTRSGTSWIQQAHLTASDGAAGDYFGISVAISGNTVVVGAYSDDVGANSLQGSAYVFVRSGTSWTEQAKLVASDGAAADRFGNSVAVSGDTAVVGATYDDVGADANQGSAYVFVRSGTSWSQQAKLTASDGTVDDLFGISMVISGDTLVVGASYDDVGADVDQGSAYVFTRSGTAWTQRQKLSASDGLAGDRFGDSVALSGDTIVVGAFYDDGMGTDAGSAYVFAHSGTTWYQRQQLAATTGEETGDHFGASVAISGDTIVAGVDGDNVGAVDQGSAYIFIYGFNTAPGIVASGGLIRQQGSPAALYTIATVDDAQDPIGYLTITVASAPDGISITNITNNNGTITALVAASCTAALGNNSVVLQVEDSDGGVDTAYLVINVTSNAAPTLGIYPNTSVAILGSTTVTPSVAPSDNGTIVYFSATSPTFTGILSVNLGTGVVTISNARPGGNHFVTVTALDNCGITKTSGFTLRVNCQTITVNPATIPAGVAGTAYSQTFTQAGGIAPVTFTLAGMLPAGLSFNPGTATLSGTPTEVGDFPFAVTATDDNNCSGSRNYTLSIGAPLMVWNGSTSSDWHTAANWSPNAVPTSYHDVLIPTAGVTNQPTIGAGSSAIHAMNLESSRVLTINASRQLITQGNVTSTGQIAGAGKFVFDGASFTQNGSVSVASVEFDAGDHALSGGGSFASGIVTILNGANLALMSDHQMSVVVINSGGSFDITGRALTLTGAGTPMFNSGTCTMAGSTLIYAGSVAQVVTEYLDYYNLTINNPAGVSLADEVTINGELNLLTDLATGAFTLNMPGSATSTGTADVIGNVRRTGFVAGGAALSFGNPLNTILINSGSAPSEITLNLVKSSPAGFSNTVQRTYTITPVGGSGYSATLRLRYKDGEASGLNESGFELWRYTGTSWASPGGAATRDTTNNWVEESGITEFSPWTIAGPGGPTAVELIGFTATGYDDGVLLEWRTGFEVNNLGFNLYCDNNGRREQVNRDLIAGSALTIGAARLESGRAYAWYDKGGGRAAAQYWLEDLDLDGTSTWHGPFVVQHIGGKLPIRTRAAVLAGLGAAAPLVNSGRLSTGSIVTAIPAQGRRAMGGAQEAVKLAITQEGWYRVTGAELLAAGLRIHDPSYLQMYVEGIEQPILIKPATVSKGAKDEGYAVEFYATGLDLPSTDTRIYWLVAGTQPGKRVTVRQSVEEGGGARSFDYTVERRERSIYFAALRNGESENFFGRVITAQAIDLGLAVVHLDQEAGLPAELELAVQGVTELAGSQDHQVEVKVNGAVIGRLVYDGQQHAVERFNIPSALLREGDNIITLSALNGPSDISLVDYARLTYRRLYVAKGDQLRCAARSDQGRSQTIAGFTEAAVRVIDVTDASNVEEIEGKVEAVKSGGYAINVDVNGEQRELLAFTDAQVKRPLAITLDRPSVLRQPNAAADLVIITRREFMDSFGALAQLRRKQGLKVIIVDVEDVYDEFNFGEKSAAAVREFLLYTQVNWRIKPAYLLLAGAASYDPKDYLGFGETDLVPTKLVDTGYMETGSDEWLVDFNGDGIGDMAIGRLPVKTREDATSVVSKLMNYEGSAPSNTALLVSDEGFAAMSESLRPFLGTLQISEVKRGELGDELAREQLLGALNGGPKVVNYFGHGAADSWRGGLLQAVDAGLLSNGEQLSVFILMTCLNGYYDAGAESLGAALLQGGGGGAIAVWASTGMTLVDGQAQISREFYNQVFGAVPLKGKPLRLGEAAQRAKAATGDMDVRRTWVLLGDPTMRLR